MKKTAKDYLKNTVHWSEQDRVFIINFAESYAAQKVGERDEEIKEQKQVNIQMHKDIYNHTVEYYECRCGVQYVTSDDNYCKKCGAKLNFIPVTDETPRINRIPSYDRLNKTN